ncbi:MAG: hypothetical protein QOG91_320 [Candidatus Parcubacteria bacterium]|jgi:hypothetical protein|nr:hypothetical protein [Candidatus Parcubacteria bacterium]
MKPKSSKKTLIVIVVIVVIAAAVYFYFQGGSAPVAGTAALQTQTETADVGRNVNFLLNQVEALKIDALLFKDTAYGTLVDYTVQIPPQIVGRDNPFAPIPGVTSTPIFGGSSR